ncbi:MAG: hypothetical protein IJU93_09400 [Lachnospiraceae bacterium]|nr:hypothetical protein [Lachnospiraceae bacterium]
MQIKAGINKEKTGRNDIFVIAMLSLVFSFMLFIFAPVELYKANHNDMWFDIYTMLSVVVIAFAACFIANFVVLMLLRSFCLPLFKVVFTVEAVCLLCLYIHGNFMVQSLPSLDGHYIVWDKYRLQMVISLVVTVILSAGTAIVIKKLGFKRFYRASSLACLFLFALLSITLMLEIATAGDRHRILAHKTTDSVTVKDEMLYSKEANYIILLLDKVDSSVFNDIALSDNELSAMLDGFTYYRDAMGIFPRTKFAVPLVLTGEKYTNKGYFEDYYRDGLKVSPILNALRENDYEVSLYERESSVTLEEDAAQKYENILSEPLRISSRKAFLGLIMRLVMFKYAPYGLKSLFDAEAVELSGVRDSRCEYPLFSWEDRPFYDMLLNEEVELTDNRIFKFIHLEGAHSPYNLLGDMTVVEDDTSTYEEKARACTQLIKTYLDVLKKNDLYDNSVLVIMADHGEQDGNLTIPHGEFGQNPLLLMKGVGEHHELSISQAPVYFGELQTAFIRLLEGQDGGKAFDAKEGDEVSRLFYYYKMKEEKTFHEYEQQGKAYDNDKFKETGRVLQWEP